DGWRRAIEGSLPFAEFLLKRLMGPIAPDSPIEARRVVDRLRPVLQAVRDPVERGMYIQRIARHLRVNEADVAERLRLTRIGFRSNLDARHPEPSEEPAPDEVLLAFL